MEDGKGRGMKTLLLGYKDSKRGVTLIHIRYILYGVRKRGEPLDVSGGLGFRRREN